MRNCNPSEYIQHILRLFMISNLQGLRGLAALAVVFFHTGFTFNCGVRTDFMAVSVFFVISGFIMTYITREGGGDAGRFLIQRLIRIVPLYWLCTLVFLVFATSVVRGQTWQDLSLENVIKSLLFIPYLNSVGEPQPLLSVGWTLNFEMFFYLIFAAMLIVTRRLAPFLVCIVLIAIRLAKQQFVCTTIACNVYASNYITFFIEGIMVYYVWNALKNHVRGRTWSVASIAVMVALFFGVWNAHPPFRHFVEQLLNFPFTPGYLMPPLLVTTVLIAHSAGLRIMWIPAIILGDASYALYLTHMFVLASILKTLKIAGVAPYLIQS